MTKSDFSVTEAWRAADLASGSLSSAAHWRNAIAQAVAVAADARFAAVFTCPPGRPLDAQFATWPLDSESLVREVVTRFLPRIERGKDASPRTVPSAAVFAPLESANDQRLAEKLRRELYAPSGIDGLIVAPLVLGNAPYWMGWIVVASASDSATLLREVGPKLQRVAEIATRTLEQARMLAEAVGAAAPAAPPPGLSLLSKREREVIDQVLAGRTDAEIAFELHISEQTVGSHLKRIYEKLGVHSRVELAAQMAPPIRQW